MDDDSSSKFIESLTKFLQSLCNGYVEFNRGVELVGHIYLNIDTGEKVDYVLHEKVSKNDENSVTFVSNSFHALAKEREGKTGGAGANASKTANPRSASDDDDDILILDQPDSGMVGSTNSGTLSSRGVKRPAPGGSDQRRPGPPMHRGHGSSMGRQPGPWRNRQQAGPSATTVSSENMSQGNLSIGEVKLEQISSDELLSLASHVDGTSSQGRVGSGAQSDHGSFSPNDAPGQGWIKQEPTDENQRGLDTGWSQSDSSNSGSNLYPVMMHQNSSGYTSSAPVHGFSPTGAASSRHSFGQSLPGTSSASPFASPMPGTSQNMGGMDPSDDWLGGARIVPSYTHSHSQPSPAPYSTLPSFGPGQHRPRGAQSPRGSRYNQEAWLKLKQNPERYEKWKLMMREVNRKSRLRRKMRQQMQAPLFSSVQFDPAN